MLQSLIHSLPEQNFLVVRYMIEFFNMLVSMLSKGVNSPPTSIKFDGPSSSDQGGTPQSRPGYKAIIEKIFAAFYPMFLCHQEQDESFDLPNNNAEAGHLSMANTDSESDARGNNNAYLILR